MIDGNDDDHRDRLRGSTRDGCAGMALGAAGGAILIGVAVGLLKLLALLVTR